MMHRILVVASMALFLAACARRVTLDPDPNGGGPSVVGVSVAPEAAVLVPGGQETVQLTATVTGVGAFDESVTWTSGAPSVATVGGSGLVSAVDDGIAVVTATSVSDPAASGSATIRVQRAVVVTDVTPAVSANLVPIDTVLTATFNVAMDPGTIDDTTFTLRVGTLPVSGTVGYDDASRTATFTPATALTPDTVYEAAISREVRSASGGTLAGVAQPARFAWSFWTALGPGTGPEPSIGGIDVTPATATIVRGVDGPLQLTATLTDVVGDPNRAVTWTSDAPGIATVDAAGIVTAGAPGVATITARSVFDRSVTGSARITVQSAEASIGGIDVTPSTATLTVGGSRQLTATPTGVVGDPDLSVTWSSSAPGVATVSSSGLVSAVGVGNATITATSAFDATVSGSAAITVQAAAVLRLSYPSPYVYRTGAAFTIDPVVENATGTVSFSWVPVHTRNESNWSIDETSGRISRGTAGGPNNFGRDRNGDRTYVVTVRDGAGQTATFEVVFIEVAPG
jgi:uncharacterized protein YjdB